MSKLALAACAAALAVALGIGLIGQRTAPGQNRDQPRLRPAADMDEIPAPTRLEAFQIQRGTVIVKGYNEIGHVQGDDGSTIIVTALELTDSAAGARESGLAIDIRGDRASGSQAITYVDYDEIDALVAAIESIRRLDNTASKLPNVEGMYRTRGDLEVSGILGDGGRMAVVRGVQVFYPSGEIATASSQFRLTALSEFQRQITAGKQALDRARAPQ